MPVPVPVAVGLPPMQTLPVSRTVNQYTEIGHTAVQLGGLGFSAGANAVRDHADVLQKPFFNKITGGRAAGWQAPLEDAMDGAAAATPQVMASVDKGVSLLGVGAKQFGWAANNGIRAVSSSDQAYAQEKLELASRQVDRGVKDVQKLADLVTGKYKPRPAFVG